MQKPLAALQEIETFLKDLDLAASAFVDKGENSKNAYAKYQAILIWQIALKGHSELSRSRFFEEFLSDLSSAYLFLLSSAYKPSGCMLRSSLENLSRSIVILRGASISGTESVSKVFEKSASLLSGKGLGRAFQIVKNLQTIYGQLCKTVHSSSHEFMGFRVPFSQTFEFDLDKYGEAFNSLRDVFNLTLEILYILEFRRLEELHHRAADAIKDALPPTVKASVRR